MNQAQDMIMSLHSFDRRIESQVVALADVIRYIAGAELVEKLLGGTSLARGADVAPHFYGQVQQASGTIDNNLSKLEMLISELSNMFLPEGAVSSPIPLSGVNPGGMYYSPKPDQMDISPRNARTR